MIKKELRIELPKWITESRYVLPKCHFNQTDNHIYLSLGSVKTQLTGEVKDSTDQLLTVQMRS